NGAPAGKVHGSPLMARLAQAVHMAGSITGGLVDATLIDQIETAGYATDLGRPLGLARVLELAPERRPAGGSRSAGWRRIAVDVAAGTPQRPPRGELDSGGAGEGPVAGVLGEAPAGHGALAPRCGGRLGARGAGG